MKRTHWFTVYTQTSKQKHGGVGHGCERMPGSAYRRSGQGDSGKYIYNHNNQDFYIFILKMSHRLTHISDHVHDSRSKQWMSLVRVS